MFIEELNVLNEAVLTKVLKSTLATLSAIEAEIAYDAVVANDAVSGTFKANDAVVANEELNTDIEEVWLLVIALLPFTDSDPVIETEPVNTCVFERLLPKILEPEL